MITQETAHLIWCTHREIHVSEKLLADIAEAIAKGEPPTPLDVFGRQTKSFELGVPSGAGSHRLFNVAPRLAQSVIRAHIGEQQSALVAANEQARMELSA